VIETFDALTLSGFFELLYGAVAAAVVAGAVVGVAVSLLSSATRRGDS